MSPRLVAVLEGLYPDYTVDSFEASVLVDYPTSAVYRFRDVRLTGRHKLSADGRTDGQPVPMVVAPSWRPAAGLLVTVSKQEEFAL